MSSKRFGIRFAMSLGSTMCLSVLMLSWGGCGPYSKTECKCAPSSGSGGDPSGGAVSVIAATTQGAGGALGAGGTTTLSTSSNDVTSTISSAGVGGTSAGTGGSAAAGPVTFPVKYAQSGRTLEDQNGTPFPILGRTAWFLVSRPAADRDTFLSDTVARGHNAVELHVIDHDPRGNDAPFNGNGDLPFLHTLNGSAWAGSLSYGDIAKDGPDFTTPNEAYWTFIDAFLAACDKSGILVLFFPVYVGYNGGDQGWMQEIVANGPAKMNAYGAWIGARYKDQKNLVWMMGGDMGTGSIPFNQEQTSVESGLLTGIKSVAGAQSIYFSAEWSSESIGTDQTDFGTSMTLNSVYSWSGDVNTQGRLAYSHTPTEPAFLLEEPYDEEGPDGNSVNPSATQPVRRFQWWGFLSTIGGYMSGNGYVWPFNDPLWKDHLDTQGSRDMARLNAFVRSIAWWNLVPSGLGSMKTLVTAGGGNPPDSGYVAAAADAAGTLLVAYIPPDHAGDITVDATVMSGTSRARWYNPTTAAFTAIGDVPNTAVQSFTPPGDNGSGHADWVLVLDKNGG